MTFSLSARDPRTGAFGMVISSSSPAVAARCLHLRPGFGAVASQNITDPALGVQALDHLELGDSAQDAVDTAVRRQQFPQFRQLTAVDRAGRVAVFTGAQVLGLHAVARGDQCIAAGNLLADTAVVHALVDAFEASRAETFEQRLLDGFDGAVAAGGEAGPIRSAGLAVVDDLSWRTTDLRVDDAEDPSGELHRLLDLWLPQKEDYRTRALDPTAAASYGVPGDE